MADPERTDNIQALQEHIRQLQQRIKKQTQRADRAAQGEKQERERADRETQRADQATQRADLAAQRADQAIEQAERAIQFEKREKEHAERETQRANREVQRADQATKRADQATQRASQAAQNEERAAKRTEAAEEQNELTTLNATGHQKRRRDSRVHQPNKRVARQDRPESSDDGLEPHVRDTPTPMETRSQRRRSEETESRQNEVTQQPQGGGENDLAYCTQKCLLGLVSGGFLDPDCPNVALHHSQDCHDHNKRPFRGKNGTCTDLPHPINHKEWLQLLGKQLQQTLDDGITPLNLRGTRGVLFQVTMMMYGYTFVAKGTVEDAIPDLEHEAAVYDRLRPVQGVNVPVFLGPIDLRPLGRMYYYDCLIQVVHLTLMSWGGFGVDARQSVAVKGKSLEEMAMRSLHAIHEYGVVHNDVRGTNILVHPKMNGAMIIDFDQASLLERPRHVLAHLVPSKRARDQEAARMEKSTSRRFQEDLLMAGIACS